MSSLALSAKLGAVTSLVHAFIYFAPEAAQEFEDLGLTGAQPYFAARAAPLGAAGPELVTATFFNFNPAFVAKGIPSAWDIASPAAIQEARFRAAQAVLEKLDTDPTAVSEATEIAQRIVDGVGYEGKPLAAANRGVALPSNELVRLWQLVTIIREWRGDAHLGVLTAAPLTAVEALVTHAASGAVPAKTLMMTRQWDQQDWDSAVATLSARGFFDSSGVFTDAGRSFREQIEQDTNRAAAPLVDAVGHDEADRLCDLLKPIRSGLVASGVFPEILTSRKK